MKKNILALDTSIAKNLILCLHHHDQHFSKTIHADHLESMLISEIDTLLTEATISISEIDEFVIGCGPGSFMGLRLGFSVIRTWAFLYKKPIYLVSSLDLLIRSLEQKNGLLVPCIDAKMERVFTNITRNNQKLLKDSDLFPQDLAEQIIAQHQGEEPIHLIGTGAELVASLLGDKNITLYPEQIITESSFDLHHLEEYTKQEIIDLDKALPNYIRVSAAEMNKK